MSVNNIQAIDVHGHYGRYFRPQFTDLENRFCSADAATVVQRAQNANTQFTIVSPFLGLMPRGKADAVAGNDEAEHMVAQTKGLLQWVIIHPQQSHTYDQARRLLATPQCVGIKIHPEEHVYHISECGRAIFEFAAEHQALMLAHSGDEHSLPIEFIEFADDHPEVSLILAHLGNGGHAGKNPALQVRAIQASKHENVYTDTSSARSLFPGLIEWAVDEIGPNPILYGTDTPCYFPGSQRTRIDQSDISDESKHKILRDNAVHLLEKHGTFLDRTTAS